jgi:tRNA threonylcarbamoyladenosine biosynthesis protein TsaB
MNRPAVTDLDLWLALETSGDVCSVAVQRGETFLAEHIFRHGMHLSERLIGHIDSVLRDADATLPDVTAFAVGIGPGSFTGTRIGVMTFKTLAAVEAKPLFGVSGLEALAAEYVGLRGTLVLPLLPCRPGTVFTSLYAVGGETPLALTEPAAVAVSALFALLDGQEPGALICCGPAAPRYEAELRAVWPERADTLSFGKSSDPRAALVARLAQTRSASGGVPDDPVALVPLYIAPPPITLPKSFAVPSTESTRL